MIKYKIMNVDCATFSDEGLTYADTSKNQYQYDVTISILGMTFADVRAKTTDIFNEITSSEIDKQNILSHCDMEKNVELKFLRVSESQLSAIEKNECKDNVDGVQKQLSNIENILNNM